MKLGRNRRAVYDIERLTRLRGNLDIKTLVLLERTLNEMDYSKYRKIRDSIKKRLHEQESKIEELTDNEKVLVRGFFDKKLKEAKKDNFYTEFLYNIGWIYYNSVAVQSTSLTWNILSLLESIKGKDTEAFGNFMGMVIKGEQEKSNIIEFPKKSV